MRPAPLPLPPPLCPLHFYTSSTCHSAWHTDGSSQCWLIVNALVMCLWCALAHPTLGCSETCCKITLVCVLTLHPPLATAALVFNQCQSWHTTSISLYIYHMWVIYTDALACKTCLCMRCCLFSQFPIKPQSRGEQTSSPMSLRMTESWQTCLFWFSKILFWLFWRELIY